MSLLATIIVALVSILVGALGVLFYQERRAKDAVFLDPEEIPDFLVEHEELREGFIKSSRETIKAAGDDELIHEFDAALARWKERHGND